MLMESGAMSEPGRMPYDIESWLPVTIEKKTRFFGCFFFVEFIGFLRFLHLFSTIFFSPKIRLA